MTESTELEQDLEHLRLLVIFHYVVAAIVAMASLLPLFVALVWTVLPGLAESSVAHFGCFGCVAAVPAALIVPAGLIVAAALVVAALHLKRRTSYNYCLVVAVVQCLIVPFGFILGIATIVVLSRDSVRLLFGMPPRAASG